MAIYHYLVGIIAGYVAAKLMKIDVVDCDAIGIAQYWALSPARSGREPGLRLQPDHYSGLHWRRGFGRPDLPPLKEEVKPRNRFTILSKSIRRENADAFLPRSASPPREGSSAAVCPRLTRFGRSLTPKDGLPGCFGSRGYNQRNNTGGSLCARSFKGSAMGR